MVLAAPAAVVSVSVFDGLSRLQTNLTSQFRSRRGVHFHSSLAGDGLLFEAFLRDVLLLHVAGVTVVDDSPLGLGDSQKAGHLRGARPCSFWFGCFMNL